MSVLDDLARDFADRCPMRDPGGHGWRVLEIAPTRVGEQIERCAYCGRIRRTWPGGEAITAPPPPEAL